MARKELASTSVDDLNDMFNELYGWKDTLLKAVADMKRATLEAVYPVGSYYISRTDPTNPGTVLGFGTWTAVEGFVLVGHKAGDSDFGTIGATPGSKTIQLTQAQLPSFYSDVVTQSGFGVSVQSGSNQSRLNVQYTGVGGDDGAGKMQIHSGGSNIAHNNIQPSKVVYMWERTA